MKPFSSCFDLSHRFLGTLLCSNTVTLIIFKGEVSGDIAGKDKLTTTYQNELSFTQTPKAVMNSTIWKWYLHKLFPPTKEQAAYLWLFPRPWVQFTTRDHPRVCQILQGSKSASHHDSWKYHKVQKKWLILLINQILAAIGHSHQSPKNVNPKQMVRPHAEKCEKQPI